jgi:hypothetical protein
MADLVTTLDERDLNGQITFRQPVHDAANRAKRTNQSATEGECDQSRDDEPRQTAGGDPGGALEHHRVDIVGIHAGLDCQQVFALAIAAGIGELRQLGTARGFRDPVFQETAVGAGLGDDVLNQQLALTVLVVPAIDIDVFRVGVHIGDPGVGAAGAVDSQIVGGFAPAHGADRVEGKLPGVLRRYLAGLGSFIVIGQDLLGGLDQIEHLGLAFLDDGVAKHHHLRGEHGGEDDGQHRDDHREAVVDGKMSHDGVPSPGNRSARQLPRYQLRFCCRRNSRCRHHHTPDRCADPNRILLPGVSVDRSQKLVFPPP